MTLIVLAAGMGSRFGTRIKQLEALGPGGELLIDYSVHDAIKAGFTRVVFIIRKDIEQLFKETIGDRISRHIKTEYVFQSADKLPIRAEDFTERTKPWGTAQALYCCKDISDEPFGIINADDFYGADAFEKLAGFLKSFTADACSVGFILKNTLSDNGTVNRGVCKTRSDGTLSAVEETRGIGRNADGVITGRYKGENRILNENDTVSMSMWGFSPEFFPRLEKQLTDFISALPENDNSSELTIAEAIEKEISDSDYKVKDIPTDSKWFGITYEQDIEAAKARLMSDIDSGIYNYRLWN